MLQIRPRVAPFVGRCRARLVGGTECLLSIAGRPKRGGSLGRLRHVAEALVAEALAGMTDAVPPIGDGRGGATASAGLVV